MGKIGVLFAGQGAQYPGMGKDFYESVPAVRELFDQAQAYRPGTKEACFAGTQEALNITSTTQPCLYLTDLACYEALKEQGITADVFAGFSLGEICGLAASGILSKREAFELVCLRGESMKEAASKTAGSMLAVLRESKERVEELCAEYGVYPVNYNCPGQIAVSGETKKIDEMKEALAQLKIRAVPIAVSGPFHTPYMGSASEKVAKQMGLLEVCAPKTPLYSNATATFYDNETSEIIKKVSSQISNPVRFEEILKDMYEAGVRIFIECGPGKTLSGFVKRTLPGDVLICNVADPQSLKETIDHIKEYNETV